MKAVVLAAGEGKRMRPLTATRPKEMLPIANKPILEHLLAEFKKAGVAEFVFVVGYHDETVRDYFGDGRKWAVGIEYVTQQEPHGTAHAVQMVGERIDENFLLVNGDIIVTAPDIDKLLSKKPPALCLIEAEDAKETGAVRVKGKRVTMIMEKAETPPSPLVNAGLYFLDKRIFAAISKTGESVRGEYELTDALQLLIDEGTPVSYERLDHWLHVSYPWDLLTANETLLSTSAGGNLGEVEAGATIKGPVSIGRGTTVRAGSYIVGPVIIGENCEIGPNCYIRPSTAIGSGCHIGAAVEVKNSIIMRGTKLPHHNYVGDSIVGEDCNFGAGAKIANLRLDKEEIAVAGIETKRRKLGAVIGDKVEIGINVSIDVGSLIGDHSFIGPGEVVNGIILPNSRIFG
ncbi:MAG TPA: NTP transferase domain-containing protein [Dehalococcoidia bacterium]|nr:NTP transferase domain-containing protein [Dehalococcoidia bacterium]